MLGIENVTLCNDTEYKEVIEKLFKDNMNDASKNVNNYNRTRQRGMFRRKRMGLNTR